MTAQERLERVLKDIDTLINIARKGAYGCETLDEKVAMHRVAKDLEGARNPIRKNHFAIEDAEKYAEKACNCPTCGNVTGKDMID